VPGVSRAHPGLLLALLVLSLGACEGTARGGAGESCTRRDDCEEGLRCVAQVCVEGAADAGVVGTAVGAGGDCRARRDCLPGLVCRDQRCEVDDAALADDRYSARGESCEAKNDCLDELACVMGVCRDVSVPLMRVPKSCYRLECEADEECCTDFVPSDDCDLYQENCETDPIFCNTYRSLCECNQRCEEALCTAGAPGCESDAECVSQQTPFCVDRMCKQCADDTHCQGVGSTCEKGVCRTPCQRHEECALLSECQDGRCVEVGCKSDRECVFLLGDTLAECLDTECLVPCQADSDCMTAGTEFQICEGGKCVFVGCESDAECRALLQIENTSDPTRAVCR